MNLEQIESRRLELQGALDAQRSAAERNRWGQFATPADIAREIARCVERYSPISEHRFRFADPALGTGSFFSAALSVLGASRLDSGVGIELDPRFASAARQLWSEAGLEVIEADFTKLVESLRCPRSPNLILANPPYVRHHHLQAENKLRLQSLVEERCGIKISGLAGLYAYFLLLATEWMDEDGIAAWLIPSEFMDVNYGAAIKDYLTTRVTLERIHRFDSHDVQFSDAFVSSVVLFFRKRIPDPGHIVEMTLGGSLKRPAIREPVSLATLSAARKWTRFPADESNDRRGAAELHGPMLKDYFRVQRGIATGCNKFFILDHTAALARGLPESYLKPILPSPRRLKTLVIDGDAMGYPSLVPQLCVIDCDLPEHAVQSRHPRLWEYLQTAESLGIRDGYLFSKRTPWYKQENREPAPFLCTYMGRGSAEKQPFRFIWNRSRAIGTNLYLMLYPIKSLATMLRRHPERHADIFNILQAITGYELRGEGRIYGGGLNKIEPSELGRISATAFVEKWPDLAASPRHEARRLFV